MESSPVKLIHSSERTGEEVADTGIDGKAGRGEIVTDLVSET